MLWPSHISRTVDLILSTSYLWDIISIVGPAPDKTQPRTPFPNESFHLKSPHLPASRHPNDRSPAD